MRTDDGKKDRNTNRSTEALNIRGESPVCTESSALINDCISDQECSHRPDL